MVEKIVVAELLHVINDLLVRTTIWADIKGWDTYVLTLITTSSQSNHKRDGFSTFTLAPLRIIPVFERGKPIDHPQSQSNRLHSMSLGHCVVGIV